MRAVLALLVLISSSSALATRYGRDERIYSCLSDSKSVEIGANQAFQLHVVDRTEITITRKADGAFMHAPASRGGYFLFGPGESTGNLLPGSGYISSFNGSYDIAIQTGRGQYKNGGTISNCTQIKVISEYDPMTETEKLVESIGDEAGLNNGGYDFTRFDRKTLNMSTEKNELIEEGKDWEQCTWEMVEDFPTILKLIAEHNYDDVTAEKIKQLTKTPGLTHALAYVSDDDISCSNTIVRLYTKDNIRFELYYQMGD